ncbi:MAG: aryl-sulfate sulfotransferase [Vibrio sp.]|uniref:aryl-sulfate sulfotransferase n=1 Tax=Vibrio sp. TaxID=678 RepID=UPI003A88B725
MIKSIKLVTLIAVMCNYPVIASELPRANPDSRPPINQGIDENNALVLEHQIIYEELLSFITLDNDINNPSIIVNPYSTAPSSAYVGIYVDDDLLSNGLTINVKEYNDSNSIIISKTVAFTESGSHLIPISGLVPETINEITLESPGLPSYSLNIESPTLPDSDSEIVSEGFIIPNLKYKTTETSRLADGLYFVTHWNRNNIAFDNNGKIRWYTTTAIPSYNYERLPNGHFLATEDATNNFLDMYEFDIVGRVHAIYKLDNKIHHSIKYLPNNQVIVPSEWTEGRDGSGSPQTVEDGISIIDLSTGQESAYYDMIDEFDPLRTPQPTEEFALAYDWLHINQAYVSDYGYGSSIVFSSREQNMIAGINKTDGSKKFIFSPHDNWSEEFIPYLLEPVNSQGESLYDLNNSVDAELADKEFWTWGQHSVVEVSTTDENIFEFYVFDNGNYRSYTESLSLLPTENWSRVVQFRVNQSNKTVEKIWEYGNEEVGNRGYTSYVGSVVPLSNNNVLINFGSVVVDNSGNILTSSPGYSDLIGVEDGTANGQPFIQEIDPSNNELLLELEFKSGFTKTYEQLGPYYRMDVSGFRAYKWPLYVNATATLKASVSE